jgi:hypothetical protein
MGAARGGRSTGIGTGIGCAAPAGRGTCIGACAGCCDCWEDVTAGLGSEWVAIGAASAGRLQAWR